MRGARRRTYGSVPSKGNHRGHACSIVPELTSAEHHRLTRHDAPPEHVHDDGELCARENLQDQEVVSEWLSEVLSEVHQPRGLRRPAGILEHVILDLLRAELLEQQQHALTSVLVRVEQSVRPERAAAASFSTGHAREVSELRDARAVSDGLLTSVLAHVVLQCLAVVVEPRAVVHRALDEHLERRDVAPLRHEK